MTAIYSKGIKSITMGPSPDWMQKKLKAIGLKTINNVVDLTNYVLMEWDSLLMLLI